MPELKASPRNRYIGLLADALQAGKSGLDNVQLPVVGGLGSLLMGDAPEMVNDVAYYGPQALVKGGNAATGGIGTFRPDPRILDVAGVAAGAPGAGRLAKQTGKVAVRELGPKAADMAESLLLRQGAIKPITAYHGTPHKVDKFSMDKIGTGEGAQVYGHGLYFADDPKVAKEYQRGLSGVEIKDNYGNTVPIPEGVEWVAQDFEKFGGDYKKIRDALDVHGKDYPWPAEVGKKYIDSLESIGAKPSIKGNLYTVDIPDEAVAKMLLWDKPLSEQPNGSDFAEMLGDLGIVKHYLDINGKKRLMVNSNDGRTQKSFTSPIEAKDYILNNFTGADVYGILTNKLQSKADASSKLASQGIPGIRYLDQGSRGAGSGTMNTVVFDENLIKILEENGMPVRGLLSD